MLTSDMRSDLLSLRPLHITEPLQAIKIRLESTPEKKK